MFYGEDGDLIKWLATNPLLTPQLGTGDDAAVFWEQVKSGIDTPYLRITVGSNDSIDHLVGQTDRENSILQIYCYADTPGTANHLALRVREAFKQFRRGRMRAIGSDDAGTWVDRCNGFAVDTGADSPKEGIDASRRFWCLLAVRLTHAAQVVE